MNVKRDNIYKSAVYARFFKATLELTLVNAVRDSLDFVRASLMRGDILLIDDDPMIRTVVAENLSDMGFSVHTAGGEAQALEALDRHSDLSCALVDYCLPKPVGIALAREIRARDPHIAVALFTGHDELAGARMDDGERVPVLPKTMRMDKLADALRALIEGREPALASEDLQSRMENRWRQERRRETISAMGRALHKQYDNTVREVLPEPFRNVCDRLLER